LANVTKVDGRKLVEFFDPAEFLYGVGAARYEQGGVYSRHMLGLRIERVDPAKIEAMDRYFRVVRERAADPEHTDVGFSTAFGPLVNRIRAVMPNEAELTLRER
jgi:hypothetical protein